MVEVDDDVAFTQKMERKLENKTQPHAFLPC